MKTIIMILTLLTIGITANAKALDDSGPSRRVKALIRTKVMSMEGVNGIGVSGCSPVTGLLDLNNDFVHCVVINTETQEAYEEIKGLYPTGTKIQNIFVTVAYLGEIEPQPRMSGGR